MDTPNALMQATAEQLRIANVRASMSYDEIVAASGLSKSTVVRLFGGKRVADLRQLDALASALGVDPVELFGGIFARAEEIAASAASLTVDAADLIEVDDIEKGVKSAYGKAASRGTLRADEPHAE